MPVPRPRGESVFDRLELLLPTVGKSVQYVGGELDATAKDWDCRAEGHVAGVSAAQRGPVANQTTATTPALAIHAHNRPAASSRGTSHTMRSTARTAMPHAGRQRSQSVVSRRRQAIPDRGGLCSAGPPASRWAARTSAHRIVQWPNATEKPS